MGALIRNAIGGDRTTIRVVEEVVAILVTRILP